MLELSKSIEDEIISIRRQIHSFAELGFDLEKTCGLIEEELRGLGIEPERVGRSGLSFTLGSQGPVILLRADMDALTMEEETDLDFRARNGNSHSCGHDAHAAMLLGAAKILKPMEDQLPGRVKFMFQPAEEILAGAKDMVDNGILENPKVQAALALHIDVGREEARSGQVYYGLGNVNFSGDAIRLIVKGRAAHGSTPHLGIDAIDVAVKLIGALNTLVKNTSSPSQPVVLLVGKIQAGTAVNTVADRAELEISLRTKSQEVRERLLAEIERISLGLGQVYGAEVIFQHSYGMPNMYNDPDLSRELLSYAGELLGQSSLVETAGFTGSEDFSYISQRVPSFMFSLGVGSLDEGYRHSLHHASMVLNEEALHIGASLYAYLAYRFLENK